MTYFGGAGTTPTSTAWVSHLSPMWLREWMSWIVSTRSASGPTKARFRLADMHALRVYVNSAGVGLVWNECVGVVWGECKTRN